MNARRHILLVNPAITSAKRARFPLSLLALAATLRQRHDVTILDMNKQRAPDQLTRLLDAQRFDAVGITVMGGPQLLTAIEVSRLIREHSPALPIVWGGYFPSLYPDVVMDSGLVDFAIRGEGEQALGDLLDALAAGSRDLGHIAGLDWRRDGAVIQNTARPPARRVGATPLPYELLGDPRQYLVDTFLGRRTAAHQVATGCRFRCTFCGVAAMFGGATALGEAQLLDRDLAYLRSLGADSIQYYDHNFFDREPDMVPLLEVMARHSLPWWCYARADALLNLSESTWKLVRASRLRMAYIGAETPNDALLKSIRKGTRSEQTLEVARLCRANGVIPELSFMVAPPEDPEGETERTFEFIRRVKRANPDSEIIVYVYTPLPTARIPNAERLKLRELRDRTGQVVDFPRTLEAWATRPWIDYACHADAPWLSDRLRRRIRDFVTVLNCRFPTVQDPNLGLASRQFLRRLAAWRYHLKLYDRPWELNASRSLFELLDPRVASL